MIVIVDNSNRVIYKYEGEGLYPGSLSELDYLKKPTGYKHFQIEGRTINPNWLRVKYDPVMEVFMDDSPAPSTPSEQQGVLGLPTAPLSSDTSILLEKRILDLEAKLRNLTKYL